MTPEGQGSQGTRKEGRVFPPGLIKSSRTQDAGPDQLIIPILDPVFPGDDKPYPRQGCEGAVGRGSEEFHRLPSSSSHN